MSRTPLFDALKQYEKKSRAYFRIPGHRFERGIPAAFTDFAGPEIFKLDVTETPLSDDLHNPRTVIAESQRYTAEAFGAAESFYLVNGTTCGNESMIIAAAGEGQKILIPRNAHKSVMAGLVISGAQPVYMPIEYIPELGLSGVLKPDTARVLLDQNPDARALFAVSPSYHGFCSDIPELARIAHDAEIPLLIDEAHGAHFCFSSGLPEGSMSLGADACAQSLHKTAGALTQSSLLHLSRASVETGRIDRSRIDSALRMTMSTSPSYLLLCSLELARNDLEINGEIYWAETIELVNGIRNRIAGIPGFRSPSTGELRDYGITNWDPTRLIINCDNAVIGGYDLKSILWSKFTIDVEMADPRNIVLIFTYGNNNDDAEGLINALKKISEERYGESGREGAAQLKDSGRMPGIPKMVLNPRKAFYSKHRVIDWDEMRGKVIAEAIAPYPPGIPVIYPGEFITDEIFYFLNNAKEKKIHLHGPADKSLSTVKICDIF